MVVKMVVGMVVELLGICFGRWTDKNVHQIFNFANALLLLKTMPVHQKSNSVSRKQNAGSKNQCNMFHRIANPKSPAEVGAQFSLNCRSRVVDSINSMPWYGWEG